MGAAQHGMCGVDVQWALLGWVSVPCVLVVLPSLCASRSSAVTLPQVQLKAPRDPHWPKSELEQRCWQKKEGLGAGYFLHLEHTWPCNRLDSSNSFVSNILGAPTAVFKKSKARLKGRTSGNWKADKTTFHWTFCCMPNWFLYATILHQLPWACLLSSASLLTSSFFSTYAFLVEVPSLESLSF